MKIKVTYQDGGQHHESTQDFPDTAIANTMKRRIKTAFPGATDIQATILPDKAGK